VVTSPPYTKNSYRQPIQEPTFSVSNTETEGGCDGRGCGDCIFLAALCAKTQVYGESGGEWKVVGVVVVFMSAVTGTALAG
jgi:hypothetical protein